MDPKLRLFVRTRADHPCEYWGIPQEFSELRFQIEHMKSAEQSLFDPCPVTP
jgi:hypothetical protein